MTPAEIVHKMMDGDAFSKWMGVTVENIDKGSCTLSLKVQPEMVNGFHIAHGGISYSLSDSALAFSSNAYGKQCVSIETSISYTRPAKVGDILSATCKELNRGKTIGIYEVTVTNQDHKKVAIFKGTVYISDRDWE